ncbi:MAG: ABC transporter ATP-binding protein [Rhodocyclaceae bacterium]|nr:ABC transporter ATP-binding protein [Rhodocyclaceae bacterium]
MEGTLIEAIDFSVSIGASRLLTRLSFRSEGPEPLVVVGESGAGKSTLARALAGIAPGRTAGTLRVGGLDLATAGEAALLAWRGRRASIVFQDVHGALNPQHTLIEQVAEPLRLHRAVSRRNARHAAADLLESFGLAAPLHGRHPAQCSGGQLQRALLAMALASSPDLLVLDEPTSALDPSTRALVLARLRTEALRRRLVVVTHDIDLARALGGRVLVLYGGGAMESGPTELVLSSPRHPYTRGLLRAWPREGGKDLQGIPGSYEERAVGCPFANRCCQRVARCDEDRPTPDGNGVACHRGGIVTVLAAHDLHKTLGGRPILQGVSLEVQSGETVAIVGESGTGKSTLARILVGLQRPEAGTLATPGIDSAGGGGRNGRGGIAYVPQNAAGSVAGHFSVFDVVAEPLVIQGDGDGGTLPATVRRALADVRLPTADAFLERCARSLSGGELQRLAIARALILEPALLVADEPTAALDASVQAKVLRLLLDLQEARGLALLMITHDLPVARRMADRILVLANSQAALEATPIDPLPTHPNNAYHRDGETCPRN